MHDNPDTPPGGVFNPAMRAGPGRTQEILRQYLQEHAIPLFEIIRTYVVGVGFAHGGAVQAVADDILNEMVLEALAHADRFDPTTQPRAWLLSIAANILKRKRSETTKLQQHEFLLSDLASGYGALSESDFFDQLATFSSPGPELLKTVYTRAGGELTDPQEGCKLKDIEIRSSGEQPCLGVRP
jgi:DNA-directed RNA polymerase specialized sigma24 family protein